MGALSHLRICDFTGQLAGAGATKFLAAFRCAWRGRHRCVLACVTEATKSCPG